jgi:hypothetical protein
LTVRCRQRYRCQRVNVATRWCQRVSPATEHRELRADSYAETPVRRSVERPHNPQRFGKPQSINWPPIDPRSTQTLSHHPNPGLMDDDSSGGGSSSAGDAASGSSAPLPLVSPRRGTRRATSPRVATVAAPTGRPQRRAAAAAQIKGVLGIAYSCARCRQSKVRGGIRMPRAQRWYHVGRGVARLYNNGQHGIKWPPPNRP